MTNVLDFISAPIEQSGNSSANTSASKPNFSGAGIPSLLSGPIGGSFSQSTPQIAKAGTPNIDPVAIFNSILPGVKPLVQSISQGSIKPEKEYFSKLSQDRNTDLKTIDGKVVGTDYSKVAKNSSDLVLGSLGAEGDMGNVISRIASSKSAEEIGTLLRKIGADESLIPEASKFFTNVNSPELVSKYLSSELIPKTAKLGSGIAEETLPKHIQAKAEADWSSHFADEYGTLSDRAMEVQNEIKGASKSEVPALQNELKGILKKASQIESDFVTKWKPTGNGTPKTDNVSNFLSKPVSDVVTEAEIGHQTAPQAPIRQVQGSTGPEGTIAQSIAKMTNPADIAKVLEGTGVSKDQIPQMSKVLAGVDSPKKVNNIIEGFDTTRAPKQQPELSADLSQKQTEIDLKKETLNTSPFKSVENKFMVDREGRIKELGNQKNPVVIRKMEDRMAQTGVTDPHEFSAGVEKYFQQKAEVKQLEKDFNAEKKDFLQGKKDEVIGKDRMQKGLVQTPQPDEIAMNDNFENIEQHLADLEQGKTVLDRELETIRSLPKDVQKEIEPLSVIIQKEAVNVKEKVTWLDYLRTPEHVLNKIGLGNVAKQLTKAYDTYLTELPQHIQTITDWSKQIEDSRKGNLFDYLDGKPVSLRPGEMKVATEIENYLADWADRLGLPDDNRIASYITHIFEKDFIQKEFDPDLAKIIGEKIPGQVYDPFLEKRLGKMGFVRDPWRALDAYTKRATRKVNMDPVLKQLKDIGPKLEESQWNYIKRYADRINMRPTEIDNLVDNQIKQLFGYRFGQRPVANITQKLRQMVYRGALGFNMGSAFRNLSQGANTYAVLGEKYTALGYASLMKNGMAELKTNGVLLDGFIEDRTVSSTRQLLQKVDKGLMVFFETAEKINRGSAYYGAKLKAIDEGISEEQAIDYAKHVVSQTQFKFSPIDTPVALQGDLVKVFTQFMTFNIKQTEFLAELAKTKSWGGLVRYLLASAAVMATVGKLYGGTWSDVIPTNRFTDGSGLVAPIPKTAIDIFGLAAGSKNSYGQSNDFKTRLASVIKDLTVFVPGGAQGKKTYQGIEAVSQGKDVTATGKTRYTIPQTPSNYIRAGLFGKNNLPEAQAHFNKTPASKTAPVSSGGPKLPGLPKLPSLKGAGTSNLKSGLPSLPKLPKLPKLSTGKPTASTIGSKIGGAVNSLFGVKTASAAEVPPEYMAKLKDTMERIAYNETRGVKNPYSFSQSSGKASLGKALGKYQITEADLKRLSPKYLGKVVSAKEFLATPKLQDDFMRNRISYQLSQGYSPDQIADIHRSGTGNILPPETYKVKHPEYVASFKQSQ